MSNPSHRRWDCGRSKKDRGGIPRHRQFSVIIAIYISTALTLLSFSVPGVAWAHCPGTESVDRVQGYAKIAVQLFEECRAICL